MMSIAECAVFLASHKCACGGGGGGGPGFN